MSKERMDQAKAWLEVDKMMKRYDAWAPARLRVMELMLAGLRAPMSSECTGAGVYLLRWAYEQHVCINSNGQCELNGGRGGSRHVIPPGALVADIALRGFPRWRDRDVDENFSTTPWGSFFEWSGRGLTDVAAARYKVRVVELAKAGVKVPERAQRNFDDVTVAWTDNLQMICRGDGSVRLLFAKNGFFDVEVVDAEDLLGETVLGALPRE